MQSGSDSSLPNKSSRLDGVDLLRGLAIFLVLMNHINMRLRIAKIPYTAGLPDQLVASLVWNGQRGVQIFFAISGFLITSVSLRRWTKIRVRDFYRLRFARIAPLLLLLLAVLSVLHLVHVHDFVVRDKTGGLGRALLAALTFHVNVLEATRGYLPGNWDILWSLSVEEVFYLFFPLLLWLLGRGKGFIGVLLLFVVLGPFARTVWSRGNDVWQEYSYLGGMDAIALGCLTALFVSGAAFPKRIVGITGGVIMVVSLCFTRHISSAWGLDMTLLAVGTCLVIAAASQSQWKSPALLHPLLRLGQRSYEVYLTHMFIVFAFFNFFMSHGKPLGGVPVLFLTVILVAGVLGKVVGRFYSEPMNQRLRQPTPVDTVY